VHAVLGFVVFVRQCELLNYEPHAAGSRST